MSTYSYKTMLRNASNNQFYVQSIFTFLEARYLLICLGKPEVYFAFNKCLNVIFQFNYILRRQP